MQGKYFTQDNACSVFIKGDQLTWIAYGATIYSGTYKIDKENQILNLNGSNNKFNYVYDDKNKKILGLIRVFKSTYTSEYYYK